MPRYFFDVDDGTTAADDIGEELPDLDAAHLEAVRLSGEIIKDHAPQFWGGRAWRFSVRDEADQVLFTLSFSATSPQRIA